MYSTWRRYCECCRNWLNNPTSNARAANTAEAGAMRFTTGARTAITAGARATCSNTGASRNSAMYSTTGASAAITHEVLERRRPSFARNTSSSPGVASGLRQATGSGRTCPRGPEQRDTDCRMPPTNLTTPCQLHPAAKQLDDQMRPTSLPSSLTGTSHVLSTPPYATKQLDDTVRASNPAAQPTAEFPPPSSLTVRGSSPADKSPSQIAITGHRNCLLTRRRFRAREVSNAATSH